MGCGCRAPFVLPADVASACAAVQAIEIATSVVKKLARWLDDSNPEVESPVSVASIQNSCERKIACGHVTGTKVYGPDTYWCGMVVWC